MSAKYRSRGKRQVVEAVQFRGNFDEIEKFVGGDAEFRDGRMVVATPRGALWASNGEWITKDAAGRFIAYPDHLFRDEFRPIEALP